MAVAPAWEQALPLLAAANNHGDLAVKLSSLKQVRDILLSVETAHAAEFFPYLVELQFSPETLVRKYLIELIGEMGNNTLEHLSIFLPVIQRFLKDDSPVVAKQSIISGIKFFHCTLVELVIQFQRHGIVERWLEELWNQMILFKDAVFDIIYEVGSVGPKLLAVKFMEKYVIDFTVDSNDSVTHISEVITRDESEFNVSWIVDGHPVLDASTFLKDGNKCLGILLDMLRAASSSLCLLTVAVVNSLASIARTRPMYFKSILTALLEFNLNLETIKGCHTASIQYSMRTAFLGFLRCLHPTIIESREILLKALRSMSAGDAADQVLRQIDKLMKSNERSSRELRASKDEHLSDQLHITGDMSKKRLSPMENEDLNNSIGVASKRIRHVTGAISNAEFNGAGKDRVNGISPKLPVLDENLTPVEQMIAMIVALIAEGERGVDSLEILISNIHPDLLSDIVIMNMKHLPKIPPSSSPISNFDDISENRFNNSSSDPAHLAPSNSFTTSPQNLGLADVPGSSSNTVSLPSSDISTSTSIPTDSKRDPRRDPRRLDPRRVMVPVDETPSYQLEDNPTPARHHVGQSDVDASTSSSPSLLIPTSSSENISVPTVPKTETNLIMSGSSVASEANQSILKIEDLDLEVKESIVNMEINSVSPNKVEDNAIKTLLDDTMLDMAYSPSSQETDHLSPNNSNVEPASSWLSVLPQYIELSEEQQTNIIKLALERIVNLYEALEIMDFKQTQMALIARLFAQIDINDVVRMVEKHIVSDCAKQKGHELVMNILYHLYTLETSDFTSSGAIEYEQFLLRLVKSLIDNFPSSDKSLSRILCEVPSVPDSVLMLLEDMCTESYSGAESHDADRVTQGLGAVWSLILVRPISRQACLDIALKCAVHSKDDVRAKSIRLVANKLYAISNISETIEHFASSMFLSAVGERVSDSWLSQSAMVSEKQIAGQVQSQDTSARVSQVTVPGSPLEDSIKHIQDELSNDSSISFSRAQNLISLFFALCTKKPSLLQLVFENYARAPKTVKQAVHRHIPIIIRALESSYSELFQIISDPPAGSEHLLTQVIHILSEGTTPPPDLVAIVKHLYETRIKDATILIPVLSAFSRDEVLPIFPRLVDLPIDIFQTAVAHILQGSAHTGPALTPVEVLVAIHGISPERDGIALKKVTDACSACFEQRTVFTPQVLSNALNQMVDRTPLPLLFMRTVIQAIDAFPTLVDFVMEILSKLVQRQVWRMPKLWVGFLKCISQTQPHSFRVLLQLPSPQLESALNKHMNLRGPLSAFANQPSVKTSVPRSTLLLLGIATEPHIQPPHTATFMHGLDPNSSVHGSAPI